MRRECSLEIKLESLKEHILVFFAIQLAKFGGTDESKETNRNMENKNWRNQKMIEAARVQ